MNLSTTSGTEVVAVGGHTIAVTSKFQTRPEIISYLGDVQQTLFKTTSGTRMINLEYTLQMHSISDTSNYFIWMSVYAELPNVAFVSRVWYLFQWLLYLCPNLYGINLGLSIKPSPSSYGVYVEMRNDFYPFGN